MDLETVLEKEPAPTAPLGINGVYAELASRAPYRDALEEARRCERAAREEYDRRITALQERCSHAIVAENGRSPRDPVEDPSTYERVCLCCGARETAFTYRCARPTYQRITAPCAELYISDEDAFRTLKHAAPLSPTILRRILRAKNNGFSLKELIGRSQQERQPWIALRRR